MNKRRILVLEILFLVCNILFFSYNVTKSCVSKHRSTPSTTSTLPHSLASNSIDQYFNTKFSKDSTVEIDLRAYQEGYYLVWKKIYSELMDLIRSKCIYPTELDHYEQFVHETTNYIEQT